MPKFGDYTDGGVGQATDTLLVKRGTATVRTTLDNLPASADVAGQLAQKASTTYVDNAYLELENAINTGLAGKEQILTFNSPLLRAGNTISLDPFKTANTILDGRSSYIIMTGNGTWGFFPYVNTNPTVTGTSTSKSPNNPTKWWDSLGRTNIVSAAAAASVARLHYGPRVRLPLSNTDAYGGFRWACNFTSYDAVQAASFAGLVQTLPTLGQQPSAWSGFTRIGFCHDKGDTVWSFRVGANTTSLGASFPTDGNGTNPYYFEITSTPFPNWKIAWKARHLITGAEVTGEDTTTTTNGGFSHLFIQQRDTIDGTTAVAFETVGQCTGAFVEFVQGEPAPIVGNTITASQSITRLPYANAENAVNSATPVTLTIANTGFSDRDYVYGTNIGAGAVSFAGDGFTIQKDANVAATVTQYQSFSLQYINGVWIRLS